MISKRKLNKVSRLAGGSMKYLDCVPVSIQKKLTAEQLVSLLHSFEQTASRAYESANVERTARNVARFHPRSWARKVKVWFTDWLKPVALPKLVASIRARLG